MTDARNRRLRLLEALVALGALALGLRLYQLQVVHASVFGDRAEQQHQRTVEVQATRGAVLDREQRQLAVTLESYRLFARPDRVTDPRGLARTLGAHVDVRPAELQRLLASRRRFASLGEWVDPQRIEALRAIDALSFGPAAPLDVEVRTRRIYPYDRLAAHVVGCANANGGLEGIEYAFDAALRGEPTLYRAVQDGRLERRQVLVRAPREQPRDVVLTIDAVLQHRTEHALERAMDRTRSRAAIAIVLEPHSGQILALANRPAADPNRFGQADPEALANRAVLHVYEPGSTFKMVAMAGLLERGRVRLDERIDCERGLLDLGNRTIRDVSPRELLTPHEIVQYSSNIGMVKLTRRLSPAELLETIESFGFGEKTGVELPSESRGILRPVAEWSGFTRDSLAFGQEIGVTALQMASAAATIANDGVRVAPRLVLGLREADGSFVPASPPPAVRVVSARTARLVAAMLESVVDAGTGVRARVEGYRVAGKSGTAQTSRDGDRYSASEYVASFVGFAPLEAPRVVVLVQLDSPRGVLHQGGQVAAPIFAEIAEAALRHLAVPGLDDRPVPLDPGGRDLDVALVASWPGAVRARTPAAPPVPGAVPDVLGYTLREALPVLAVAGCEVRVDGSGVVVGQQPSPGQALGADRACELRLGEAVPTEGAVAAPTAAGVAG